MGVGGFGLGGPKLREKNQIEATQLRYWSGGGGGNRKNTHRPKMRVTYERETYQLLYLERIRKGKKGALTRADENLSGI